MKDIIIKRMNLNDKQADKLVEKLNNISPELEPILKEWLDNGTVDSDKEFNGYSVNAIMRKYGISFTGALLTLDWVIKDPKAAIEAIEKGIK